MRTPLKGGGSGRGGVFHVTRDLPVSGDPGRLPGLEGPTGLARETGPQGPRALIWGWPTPIPLKARTEMPPVPGHAVYGPAAKSEARRLLREAKRARVNFGWRTKVSLLKVIHGERPLAFDVWSRA